MIPVPKVPKAATVEFFDSPNRVIKRSAEDLSGTVKKVRVENTGIEPNQSKVKKHFEPAVEKLASNSMLSKEVIYKLYNDNQDVTVQQFLELLTEKTVEQMDKAFIKEIQSIES